MYTPLMPTISCWSDRVRESVGIWESRRELESVQNGKNQSIIVGHSICYYRNQYVIDADVAGHRKDRYGRSEGVRYVWYSGFGGETLLKPRYSWYVGAMKRNLTVKFLFHRSLLQQCLKEYIWTMKLELCRIHFSDCIFKRSTRSAHHQCQIKLC